VLTWVGRRGSLPGDPCVVAGVIEAGAHLRVSDIPRGRVERTPLEDAKATGRREVIAPDEVAWASR
jgi:hypothetical protein